MVDGYNYNNNSGVGSPPPTPADKVPTPTPYHAGTAPSSPDLFRPSGDNSILGVDNQPPPVPGGDKHPGQGVTSTSPKSMTVFADNLLAWDGPLNQAMDLLTQVAVQPGGFPTAQYNANLVNFHSQNGLAYTLYGTLQKMVQLKKDTEVALRAMATQYHTTDAANSMKAADFKVKMSDAAGVLGQLGPSGAAAAPPPTGGGSATSGSGSGSGGSGSSGSGSAGSGSGK